MSVFTKSRVIRPIIYDWAHEAAKIQNKALWLPEEVPLSDDIKDWKNNLTVSEKNLVTQIFRFFTQADVEVSNCYKDNYLDKFQNYEVSAMLTAFSNMEYIHVDAYSYLLDTVGMPETEYSAFLQYKEMKDKYDYMQSFDADTKYNLAKTMAVFGAFTEGLQLFASFAILLNFPRFNKMKGMGQIVTWSVRDESLHCKSIIKLYHTVLNENPDIQIDELHAELYDACDAIIHHEDAFIDLAFEMGEVQGLTAQEVKNYVRYIGNRRLVQLGMQERYNIKENPLPWMDEILNGVEHGNFFETTVTEYTKAATTGEWDDAFKELNNEYLED